MTIDFIKYLIFLLVLGYTTMWLQINLLLSSLNQGKLPVTIAKDNKIRDLVLDKTGVYILATKISETPKLFGMMIGIPTKPQLILSRGLYDSFSPDEIEYVVLHEIGHYKLWHGVKELIAGIVLFAIGIVLLKPIDLFPFTLLLAVTLGVFFGILMIRLGRVHEYQADNYSLNRITNPKGMIQATNKFRNYHGPKYTENNNKIAQFLFYRGNPCDNRIAMAHKEIDCRNTKQ